jgi:hypothetical protein
MEFHGVILKHRKTLQVAPRDFFPRKSPLGSLSSDYNWNTRLFPSASLTFLLKNSPQEVSCDDKKKTLKEKRTVNRFCPHESKVDRDDNITVWHSNSQNIKGLCNLHVRLARKGSVI